MYSIFRPTLKKIIITALIFFFLPVWVMYEGSGGQVAIIFPGDPFFESIDTSYFIIYSIFTYLLSHFPSLYNSSYGDFIRTLFEGHFDISGDLTFHSLFYFFPLAVLLFTYVIVCFLVWVWEKRYSAVTKIGVTTLFIVLFGVFSYYVDIFLPLVINIIVT